jgi:hypothetical protein
VNRRTDAVVLGIASGLVGWEFALFLHGGLSVYFCIALGFTATVLTLESAKAAGPDTNASCSHPRPSFGVRESACKWFYWRGP